MLAVSFLRNTLPESGINASRYEPIMVVGNKRHVICFPVKEERLVFENLNGAENGGARGFQFFHSLFYPFFVRKMHESADCRVRRVHGPPSDQLRKKIAGGFYFKTVMKHLVLLRVVFIKIQKRVLAYDIRQSE